MTNPIGKFFARVSLDFASLIDARLITFVRNVVTLMGGLTALYAKPEPPLADVTASVNSFEVATQTELNRGKIEIGARKMARASLLTLMRQLAAYVEGNCLNDVQNIIATGFSPVRGASSKVPMTVPRNQRLQYTGMSGELLFVFVSVANARNYSVQTALNPEGPWTDVPLLSTSTRVKLTGLTPGKVVWARARANGASGSSEWGGPANAMAI
ncbi:MAG: hypothetical protein ACR2NX_07620 [Chthoniobacterales bacterium]